MSEEMAQYHLSPPQDYLSAPQMADRLKVSSNTVRRYMKRFKSHFKDKRKFGLHWKYPADPTMDTLKKIHQWYRRGMSRPEIDNLLSGADDTPTTQPPDKMDILGNKIDRLTDAILHLNTLIQSHAIIPGAGQQITAAATRLISDITPTPEDADTVPTSGNEKLNEITNPEKNNSVTETGEPAADKRFDDDDKVMSFSGADDSTPPPVTPSIETDPNGYRCHVIGIIVEYRDQGKTWKEIKAKLEGQGLKTFTGLDVWAIGTISNLYRKHKGNS